MTTEPPDESCEKTPSRIGKIAIEILKRIGIPIPEDKQLSLREVFFIVCLALVIPVAATEVWKATRERLREMDVHALQDRIVKSEDLLRASRSSEMKKLSDILTEHVYLDPSTGDVVVLDIFEKDRLRFREFYAQGTLLARDTFNYDEQNQGTAKKREYYDNGIPVLFEDFSLTGVLLQKKHCARDEPSNCRNYMRAFRSPLPPTSYAIYR